MAIIKRKTTMAPMMLARPGKKRRKGAGISAMNIKKSAPFSIHIGSFCMYQPMYEGSGWLMRKPFR